VRSGWRATGCAGPRRAAPLLPRRPIAPPPALQVAEVAASPAAEVCWYFPNSREQYRIAGTLTIVDEQHPSQRLLQVGRGLAGCSARPCTAAHAAGSPARSGSSV
jgi:hypothetical protein